jgi:hypothetical protein
VAPRVILDDLDDRTTSCPSWEPNHNASVVQLIASSLHRYKKQNYINKEQIKMETAEGNVIILGYMHCWIAYITSSQRDEILAFKRVKTL